MTPMKNLSQDICFYNDCADTQGIVDNLRILKALGKTSLIWVIAIRLLIAQERGPVSHGAALFMSLPKGSKKCSPK